MKKYHISSYFIIKFEAQVYFEFNISATDGLLAMALSLKRVLLSHIDNYNALRLAHYFKMSVEFWTDIQVHYDTEIARMNLGDKLEKEVKIYEPVV